MLSSRPRSVTSHLQWDRCQRYEWAWRAEIFECFISRQYLGQVLFPHERCVYGPSFFFFFFNLVSVKANDWMPGILVEYWWARHTQEPWLGGKGCHGSWKGHRKSRSSPHCLCPHTQWRFSSALRPLSLASHYLRQNSLAGPGEDMSERERGLPRNNIQPKSHCVHGRHAVKCMSAPHSAIFRAVSSIGHFK